MPNDIEEKNSNHDNAYDPDPLTILLEIANLVIQPGSLSLLAASVSAATGVLTWRDIKNKQATEIRRKLYEIDRALTDGFAALMVLASLLDQFNHLEKPIRIGGTPITGYKNAKFDLNDELENKLKWCERVFVMEEELETEISRHFPYLAIEKKITNLNIPDVYVIDKPALKLKIKEKMKPYIEELRSH